MVGRNVGPLYSPIRRTPLHALQATAGALFADFGEWQRAAAFPHGGESREQAMRREVKLVRNGVGLYDASPLGKIELIGPDALEFADRFYINNLTTLKPNRARYGIMLRETGVIFDDGTVVALDKHCVLLTTTSSGAARVAAWLEEWRQCEWLGVRVVVAPATDQWATVALTGRHARKILGRLKPECDLSNEVFPHLSFRVTKLFGSDARIYRVSFSGELTYEINVPSHKGAQLWAALLEEGREFGIAQIGVDEDVRTNPGIRRDRRSMGQESVRQVRGRYSRLNRQRSKDHAPEIGQLLHLKHSPIRTSGDGNENVFGRCSRLDGDAVAPFETADRKIWDSVGLTGRRKTGPIGVYVLRQNRV